MGVCHSSKSTSSHSREGQKVSGDANNKENVSPNQGAAAGGRRGREQKEKRT